ncbi:MAG: S-adenosylmethionine:tRNA ribosyltransferase-isomerase, partial [Prolixibacteraceae bacterium]|nr:S-adenosylmethionine:tRNA ribosyltransferase-isomerase [Prolixibacteraceae bacterium]
MENNSGHIKIAGKIRMADYDYRLPEEKIARYPLPERSLSKLLLWKKGQISSLNFDQIPEILPEGTLLVFNNTKVVRARLKFQKETGAQIEIFCLKPHQPIDYQMAFAETKSVEWKCIIGNAKKWKSGQLKKTIEIQNQKSNVVAELLSKEGGDALIRLNWDGGFNFSEIIENAGTIPIPPYLNRESEESDNTRYQTVYARMKGSVAAPTAGLHFTNAILEKLRNKGINTEEITLHVGAGTFQPVKSETIASHPMHSETVSIPLSFLKKLKSHKKKVIAVGTTSVRSLESLYWLGIQIHFERNQIREFHVSQWEAYENKNTLSTNEAIQKVISYLEDHELKEIHFTTQIIIVPGYEFKIIDGM